MAEWYYARDEERIGPVSEDHLRSLIANREVLPEALVWTAGLPNWICAKDAPELNGTSAVATTPWAAAGPLPVAATPVASYFIPRGGLPPRAAMNLQGHSAPQGDIGDWPLDDLRISQFEETLRLRKRISSAATNYRALMVLALIMAAIFVLIAFVELSKGRGNSASVALGLGVFTVMMLGVSALYFFAWRGTIRSQRWAPLTMFILFLTGCLSSLVGIIAGLSAPVPGGPVLAGVVGLLIGGLLAAASWRAFAAIPEYLSQPAWCQELVVKARL